MDCHLNCHGELNLFMATLPLVAVFVSRARSWARRGRWPLSGRR